MNDEAVYRRAPATSGLLKPCHIVSTLDGVGPVDIRPYTDLIQQFVQKIHMWHMISDWRWTLCKIVRFLALSLGFMLLLKRLWGKGSLSQSVIDGGDCRTTPATPGLPGPLYFFFKSTKSLYNLWPLLWYLTRSFYSMRHMTNSRGQVGGGEPSLKMSAC